MGAIWFWLVCAMLGTYVVLDGFDLGVGILLPWLARSEDERRQAIAAIGPVWDGNEVWLIAGGGTLLFAFPLVYASAFSGFYLPIMIVLWLLIGRGLAIELRSHVSEPLIRRFCDGLLCLSSVLLAIFYGAALANVIRGVPIGPDHYFFLPLWTDWRTGPSPGILDWYTVLGGLMALIALSAHGALYLAFKTAGALEGRARQFARRLHPFVCAGALLSIPLTVVARPTSLRHYGEHPAAWLAPAAVAAGLVLIAWAAKRGRDLAAFFGSCLFLFAMFQGAAAGLYPALLPSSDDPGRDITVAAAMAGPHTLRVGLVWWSFGMLFAIGYFVLIYRFFRGKVPGHGGLYEH